MSDSNLKSDLAQYVSGVILDDPEDLASYSVDYGGVFSKAPRIVVQPTSVEEAARVVGYAYQQDLPITARSHGFSFAGQALNEGGLILDMKKLCKIGPIDVERECIEVEAGTLWAALVADTVPQGWIPPALTSYVRTSIGGTLSAAGFSMSTFRYGTQIDHCLELDVILHTGDTVHCSLEENRELFEHVLGGFGQFGIIARSWQRLRRVGKHTRTYYLLYDDLSAHLDDQVRLTQEKKVHFLDAMVRPCYHGLRVVDGRRMPFHSHLYPMNITVETEDLETISDEEILQDLGHSKWIYAEDLGTQEFILLGHTEDQNTPKIAEIFVDVLIPWSGLEGFIRKMETHIFSRIIHVEHTILWPMCRDNLTRPMLRIPDDDMFMGIGLYSRVPKSAVAPTVAASQAFIDLALQMGGTYYLTGTVRFDAKRFEKQFGDAWPKVREVKRRYDPKGLFNPGFFVWSEDT